MKPRLTSSAIEAVQFTYVPLNSDESLILSIAHELHHIVMYVKRVFMHVLEMFCGLLSSSHRKHKRQKLKPNYGIMAQVITKGLMPPSKTEYISYNHRIIERFLRRVQDKDSDAESVMLSLKLEERQTN